MLCGWHSSGKFQNTDFAPVTERNSGIETTERRVTRLLYFQGRWGDQNPDESCLSVLKFPVGWLKSESKRRLVNVRLGVELLNLVQFFLLRNSRSKILITYQWPGMASLDRKYNVVYSSKCKDHQVDPFVSLKNMGIKERRKKGKLLIEIQVILLNFILPLYQSFHLHPIQFMFHFNGGQESWRAYFDIWVKCFSYYNPLGSILHASLMGTELLLGHWWRPLNIYSMVSIVLRYSCHIQN